MKKTTLLNAPLSSVIATMGHTDSIAIADCGLPIRGSAHRIDLALKFGSPSFLETLDTVLSELCVERAVLAEEIKTVSPDMHREILDRLGEHVKVEYLPHEEFKKLTEHSKAVVRTGECTSYTNILLFSGVTF
ncbi:MAG: D-ribose pyranase [Oscillospiraceae bacterium]|jgi:D-ribose pyranase